MFSSRLNILFSFCIHPIVVKSNNCSHLESQQNILDILNILSILKHFQYNNNLPEPPLTKNILLAKVADLKIKSSWYCVKILKIGSNTIGWKEIGRYRTPPVPVGIIIISFFVFCFLGHRQKSRFFHLIYQSNGFYDNQRSFFLLFLQLSSFEPALLLLKTLLLLSKTKCRSRFLTLSLLNHFWCKSRIVESHTSRSQPYYHFFIMINIVHHYFKNSIFTSVFIIIKCDDDAVFIPIML